jgi:hypothetical protein
LNTQTDTVAEDRRKDAIFQVLTAESVKMTAVWDNALFCFVEVGRRFRDSYCRHHQGDHRPVMAAVTTSEMLVNFYETIRSNIPEASHLQKEDILRY